MTMSRNNCSWPSLTTTNSVSMLLVRARSLSCCVMVGPEVGIGRARANCVGDSSRAAATEDGSAITTVAGDGSSSLRR